MGHSRAQGPGPQGDASVQAVLDTAFTYQGRLRSEGEPVAGTCDLQFSLWDADSSGTQIGSTQTKTGVPVTDGYFTIPDLDFGGVFIGDARWLQIAVRCPAGSGSYTTLSPRQALTAVPYALGLRPGAAIVGQEGAYSALSVSNGYPGGVLPPYEKKAVAAWTSDGTALWGAAGAGTGVFGWANATSGETYGVYGRSDSTGGYGVVGWATATGGANFGVYGQSESTYGIGVFGQATATSGSALGVAGRSFSTEGHGVVGVAEASTGYVYGVWGTSNSTNGRGVDGHAYATSGPAIGVYGQSASTDGVGVYGWATAASGNPVGVYGRSDSPDGAGVLGYASANSTSAIGVYGTAPSFGYAGYFLGNVHVEGNLSASGSKAFKIDHPLDPADRYLYHFAQEGPEVQNVYNGVVTLDAGGEAMVALPAYFSALNTGPFRYQLTPIGAPMPDLYIAEEIQGNAFRIAGGVPGKKVSWEVTAVRHDPYLRDHPAQAEVDKPAEEQDTYLYPFGYGRPEEMGLDYWRNWNLPEQPESGPFPGAGR
ncbi:MAG: hypothetical protein WHX52_04960 [Anaerolineae bacterium]